MESTPQFESRGAVPSSRYQPEGISGPENEQMYRAQLQKNLAALAFPEAASGNDQMKGWLDGDHDSLATKFGTWFDAPNRPHVHLDQVEDLQRLLAQLRASTLH